MQRAVDERLIVGVGLLRSVNAGQARLSYQARADEEVLAVEIRTR
jgi:peptide/nickel transport system substrate-binding protein